MSGWALECLADLCTILADGNWIESKDQSPQGIRLIQTGNVGEGRFKDRGDRARFISSETFGRLNCTEIFPGDCLISRLPDPVGRACLLPDVGQRMITAVDCSIVRFDRRRILPDFFIYFSQSASYRKQIADLTTGTTRDRISRSNLGTISVPLPTLAEQQRIVAILDEAFERIEVAEANARASLDSVDQARQAFESTAFGISGQTPPPIVQLGKIANFRNGLNYTKSSTGEIVPIVGVADFENNFSVDLQALDRVQIDARLGARDELAEGDILMVRSNGSKSLIGRTMLVGKVQERTGYSGFVIRTRLHSNEVSPDYLCHYLKSSVVRATLVASGAGANISSLSQGALAQLTVPCPSKFEQASIVRRLEIGQSEFDALAQIYRRKLAALAELKQSLLTRAFSEALISTTAPIADNDDFATPEQAANILAFMYWRHEHSNRSRFFGHVMGQKTLDLVERVGCVELGRTPYKDAAGPNDRTHMVAAERWAKQQLFFEFVERSGGGYDFKKLSNHSVMLTAAKTALKPVEGQLARVADILIGKDTVEAEVFDTVLAAWNNLVADGAEASDTAIIYEARENWHPDKLAIPISKFHSAIQEIRRRGLVPDGTAKVVRHRQASLL